MFYNLHTHKKTQLSDVLEIVNQYPKEFDNNVSFFSIGIHPWHINPQSIDEELNVIDEKLQLNNCLALGECGLDKRIETPIELQLQVFEKQLLLAKKHKKPVILHCVSAYQEVIKVKKSMKIETPMIIHGFSKNWQVAKSLLDNGFYLSFGKYLLRNPELSSVFAQVPNERIFLETDTVEETIIEVYKKALEIKNSDIEKQVEDNFRTVFHI